MGSRSARFPRRMADMCGCGRSSGESAAINAGSSGEGSPGISGDGALTNLPKVLPVEPPVYDGKRGVGEK